MAKSPRLSFKGYKFSEALYRNKDSVKIITAILSAVNLATLDWTVLVSSLGLAVVSLGIKLVIDAIDYYFTEVEL